MPVVASSFVSLTSELWLLRLGVVFAVVGFAVACTAVGSVLVRHRSAICVGIGVTLAVLDEHAASARGIWTVLARWDASGGASDGVARRVREDVA